MTQWGLDTLFNPAKRHMDEEKRRLQSTRAEVGDNSGGKRIDLESGKVRIQKSDDADEPDDAEASDETVQEPDRVVAQDASAGTVGKDVPDASGSATGKRSKPRATRGEPSAAAIRAAQRRGREPR